GLALERWGAKVSELWHAAFHRWDNGTARRPETGYIRITLIDRCRASSPAMRSQVVYSTQLSPKKQMENSCEPVVARSPDRVTRPDRRPLSVPGVETFGRAVWHGRETVPQRDRVT